MNEEGPGDIFSKFRDAIGVREGPIEGFLPKVFSCIFCLTMWMAFASGLLWLISPIIVIIIAAAAIALVADRLVTR